MPGCQANLMQGGSSTLASLAQKVGLSGGSAGSMRTGTQSDSFMGGKKRRSRKVRRSKKAKKSHKAKKGGRKSRKARKSRKSRR